jgi:hypothetical protein
VQSIKRGSLAVNTGFLATEFAIHCKDLCASFTMVASSNLASAWIELNYCNLTKYEETILNRFLFFVLFCFDIGRIKIGIRGRIRSPYFIASPRATFIIIYFLQIFFVFRVYLQTV